MATPITCDAAVVFTDHRLAAGLRDRLNIRSRTRGAGFDSLVGRLLAGGTERLVVAVVPSRNDPIEYERIVAAMTAAYQPRLMIGAGPAIATGSIGSAGSAGGWARLGATEVRRSASAALRLAPAVDRLEGVAVGPFLEADEPSGTDPAALADAVAVCDWGYRFAEACVSRQAGCAVVAVAASPTFESTSDSPPDSASEEQRNLTRQRSIAGSAGALLRLLALRPSEAPAAWRRKQAEWEGQEQLADLVIDVLTLSGE